MADFRPCGLGKPRSLALSVPLVPWILIPVWVRVWVRIRENPKVIFPLKTGHLRAGKEISARLRGRAGPVKTRGTKRPARSQHHWPVCGFRRRSKEITPARSQASLGPFLRSVWRGSNPLRKISRIRPVPRSVPKTGFPRKTTDNTGERSEAGESPDAVVRQGGYNLPQCERFSGIGADAFSPLQRRT